MSFDRDGLIGDIYASATDAAGWNQVFAKFQGAFSGHSAIYERLHASPETHQLLATDLDPEFVGLYNRRYNARNVWATSPLNQAAPVVVSERIIGTGDLERTEFYGDWLQPQRLKHALTCPLVRQDHRSLNLGLVRDGRRGGYEPEDVRLLESLLPHLRRAIEIGTRVETTALARQASLDMVTADGACLLIVSRSGEIHFASDDAERLLNERTIITAHGRRLRGVSRLDNVKLERAIHAATTSDRAPTGSLMSMIGPNPDDRYSLAITPVSGERVGLFSEQHLSLILLVGPKVAVRLNLPALAGLFNLTGSEARLAAAICSGQALADYAAANGVSVTTVKTHLSALFGKTGVNRQADLVRIVLANPVLSWPLEKEPR
jgi:DNA-binding CsgD family transcriptional regulator